MYVLFIHHHLDVYIIYHHITLQLHIIIYTTHINYTNKSSIFYFPFVVNRIHEFAAMSPLPPPPCRHPPN